MIELNSSSLQQALKVLGDILLDRNLYFEVVAIGGGGLVLLGLTVRPTKDLDLVALVNNGNFISAHPLPKPLLNVIEEVGIALNLGKNWVNSDPAQLFSMGLPEGFATRMDTQKYGGLTLHLAGRFDQICFKLYAAVDQGPHSKHFTDLKLLKPHSDELDRAANWCKTHDVSEGFAINLSQVLAVFGD